MSALNAELAALPDDLLTRKSKFRSRQKLFVRNFLADQLSINQYYLFPGNKNPNNPTSALTPLFAPSRHETQSGKPQFLQRSHRKLKDNATMFDLKSRAVHNKSVLSSHSHK